MKISNFRMGIRDRNYAYATVDVTTGMLWWKETTTKEVYITLFCMEAIGGYWKWADTHEWTPKLIVEHLYAEYKAKHELFDLLRS